MVEMSSPPPGLTRFVPRLLPATLAELPGAQSEALERRFDAVVVFVDISGFTALATELAAEGPRGAEGLSRVLNDYFGDLADRLTAWGGDIVAFAGDSAIAAWPVDAPEILFRTAMIASACALEVVHALDGFDTGHGPLRVRAVIAAGPVRWLQIGGEQQEWVTLLDGAPLVELGPTDAQTHRGEVGLAPSAVALLQDRARLEARQRGVARLIDLAGELLRPTHVPPEAPSMDVVGQLANYLPRTVVRRMGLQDNPFLAEFRRVTVVFGSLVHALPELAGASEVAQTIQRVVGRLDGTVYQTLADDKGTVFVLAFGLPHAAHEDDAARGCEAGLAIHQALSARGIEVRVGIATGTLFCGAFGGSSRQHYGPVGTAINLAARLMAVADGVLCDEATVAAAQGRILVSTSEALDLKGFHEPVVTYAPTGVQARQREFSGKALVGRAAERDALEEALSAAEAGQGTVVLLEGEAGIGKSHVVHVLEADAKRRGLRLLRSNADPRESATSWFVWREVLAALYGDTAEDRRVGIEAALADQPRLLEWAPVLDDVLDVDLEANDTTRGMTGHARADGLAELLVALLRAACTTPTLWVVEDGHWLDDASWGTLPTVARAGARPAPRRHEPTPARGRREPGPGASSWPSTATATCPSARCPTPTPRPWCGTCSGSALSLASSAPSSRPGPVATPCSPPSSSRCSKTRACSASTATKPGSPTTRPWIASPCPTPSTACSPLASTPCPPAPRCW